MIDLLKRFEWASALALSLLIASCAQPSSTNDSVLENRLSDLENKVSGDELVHEVEQNRQITIQPTGEGYVFADTDIGRLTFQIVHVEALADGSQVTLKIGNPTSAKITRLTAKIGWGSADANGACTPDKGAQKDAEWNDIPLGSWHIVTINVPSLPPNKLGCLTLDQISVASMELYTR